MKKSKQFDMLQIKKKELDGYINKFSTTVSMITNAVDILKSINRDIDEKTAEINEYVDELGIIKLNLEETKYKNERVIKNFNALLE